MQSVGYRVIPVNESVDTVLGETSYTSFFAVPETIEVVDLFRSSEAVPAIEEEAIQLKVRTEFPKVVWMQLGIVKEKAARHARDAGFIVVMDRCMIMEHKRLSKQRAL